MRDGFSERTRQTQFPGIINIRSSSSSQTRLTSYERDVVCICVEFTRTGRCINLSTVPKRQKYLLTKLPASQPGKSVALLRGKMITLNLRDPQANRVGLFILSFLTRSVRLIHIALNKFLLIVSASKGNIICRSSDFEIKRGHGSCT